MEVNTNLNLNNKKIVDTIKYNGRYVNVETFKRRLAYAVAMLVAMGSAVALFFMY